MLRRPNEENLRENGKILEIWRRKNFYLKINRPKNGEFLRKAGKISIFAVLIYPPGQKSWVALFELSLNTDLKTEMKTDLA